MALSAVGLAIQMSTLKILHVDEHEGADPAI